MMAFANNRGFQPLPLNYFLYPLVLIGLAVSSWRLTKKDKLNWARVVSAIPIGLFIVFGGANLDRNVPRMHEARVYAGQMAGMGRAIEAAHLAKYPEGHFTEMYDNGQTIPPEGIYNADGYKDGLVTTWYENGQLKSEKTYSGGRWRGTHRADNRRRKLRYRIFDGIGRQRPKTKFPPGP